MDFYIRQVDDSGIGNFIQCTPAIKHIANTYKKPVPVYFETDIIKKLYLKCPFIRIISKRHIRDESLRVLFTSRIKNYDIPDFKFILEWACKTLDIEPPPLIPLTYVDEYESDLNDHVVFIRGCGSEFLREKKNPGNRIYFEIIDAVKKLGLIPVFIGGEKESKDEDFIKMVNYAGFPARCVFDSPEISLRLICEARAVVSNDTGFYHASGALEKPTFVLWGETWFEKNKSPSKTVYYSHRGNYFEDFLKFVELNKLNKYYGNTTSKKEN